MAKKITRTQVGTDPATYVETNMTLVDQVTGVVSSVFKVFSDDDAVFYPERTVGLGFLGGMAAGVFVGDRFGESIPVLGQRRNR